MNISYQQLDHAIIISNPAAYLNRYIQNRQTGDIIDICRYLEYLRYERDHNGIIYKVVCEYLYSKKIVDCYLDRAEKSDIPVSIIVQNRTVLS